MEKELNQLELFSQEKERNQPNLRLSSSFMRYISKYERVILIIIGFIITGITSFSFGVEKGKRVIMQKTGSQLDVAVKAQPALPQPAPVAAPKQLTKETQYEPAKKDEPKPYMQNYTIQVASFSNRVNAQKEADILKRKGLVPVVLSKGKFSIVCVGNFSKREEAESLLPKLKKQYQDCRIRRL